MHFAVLVSVLHITFMQLLEVRVRVRVRLGSQTRVSWARARVHRDVRGDARGISGA